MKITPPSGRTVSELLDRASKMDPAARETWLSELQKRYQGKVSYQGGYAPPATTALSTTNGTPTG